MELIVQSIINGLLLGGLYASIGLGMSLVFGIMGLTNLAHGNFIILASYLTMVMAMQFAGNMFLAILVTVVVMLILGFFTQSSLINRVIRKGSEPALLITFGISIILQNALLLIFGATQRTISTPFSAANLISTKWVSISYVYMINFIVSVVIVIVIHFIIRKTYFGRSIQAASENVVTAELMGIATKRTYSYTMALAMGTAAVAGLLVGMTFNFYPSVGTQYLVIAFGVVVIGGMGSVVGTLVGGMVLGIAQMLGSVFFGTAYQIITGYVVMLIILAIRPQGLLGTLTRK